MQSDVPVDIQEIDKSSAVVSYTPPNVKVCAQSTDRQTDIRVCIKPSETEI